MKTLTHRVLGLVVGAALAVVAFENGGCGKKEETPLTPDAAAAGEPRQRREPESAVGDATEPAQAGVEAATPDLPGVFATPALFGVPRGAPFVVVGSPKKILDALGYAGLLEKYGALLGSLGAQMAEVSGKDFFKLSSWAEIGIDLEGSMGIFMPELDSGLLVTFVSLSDGAKFEAFVSEMAKKLEAPVKTEKLGLATLLTVGDRDRNAWLVHGKSLFAVASLEGNGAAAAAKEIAARKEADSIVALAELKPALEGFAKVELAAFVQLKGLLGTVVARAERPAELATGELDQALVEAKKAGDAAAVARLEASIADEKHYAEQVLKRHAAEAELAKALVNELSTLSLGLDFSADAVLAQIRLPLAAGGMLRGLLKTGSEVQPILRATTNQPLLLVGGQVDPAACLAMLEKVMATDGEDLAEMKGELKQRLGIDLDNDILGALTGEIGFALTGDIAKLLSAEDPRSELGGAFLLGLKSDAGLKAIAKKVASQEGVDKFLKWDEATSALTVSVTGEKTFQVTFADNRLIASTELTTATHLSGGATFVSGLANAKLKALLERKDLAAVFAMQQAFAGAWLTGGAKGHAFLPELPATASREAKAKLDELKKLDAEIAPLREAIEQARMKPLSEAFEKVGTLAEAVSLDAMGAQVSIGVYPKGATLPEVIAALIDTVMQLQRDPEPSQDDERLRDLEDRRWKLESELMGLSHPGTDKLPAEEPKAP